MIANLRPYAEYKESGSKWLGAVPAKWEVRNLRTLISKRAERDRADLPLLSVAREKGVFMRSLTDADENHNVIPEDLSNYKVARAGNLVINKMKAWQGSMGIAPCDGIVSPAYFVFDFRIANHAFGQRLLRSKSYVAHFGQASDGVRVGQWDLSIPGMRQIPVLVPPPAEQAAIVRFLDWANGRLEQAIRAKRKAIALLQEQRQVIIHRAVTHGLDASVSLKSSGIPWLGDIPQHWEVQRFKKNVGFQEGPGIMLSDFRDAGVPLLRISCLAGVAATLAGCNFLSPARVREKWSHFAVKPGDYLLSASGSTGAVRRASAEVVGAIPYTGIIRLWPKACTIDMEYLQLFMLARPFTEQIAMAKSGVGIEHFGPTHLKRMWILQPPVEEQAQIVEWVTSATSVLDRGVARLEREIELLCEYRTRLTADVVTGKIDVREAASNLPHEPHDTGESAAEEPSDLVDEEVVAE